LGGLGLVVEPMLVDTAAAGRRTARIRKKHRTEVTEVTEGGSGLVGEPVLADTAAAGRELRESVKSIA
jgi:hypothetical protein